MMSIMFDVVLYHLCKLLCSVCVFLCFIRFSATFCGGG